MKKKLKHFVNLILCPVLLLSLSSASLHAEEAESTEFYQEFTEDIDFTSFPEGFHLLEDSLKKSIPVEDAAASSVESDAESEFFVEDDFLPDDFYLSDPVSDPTLQFSSFQEESLPETEDPILLFEAYASEQLGTSSVFSQTHSYCGQNLRGTDARLYKALKTRIEKIADGTTTRTVVAIPMAELGFPARLYGEDLGLNPFTSDPKKYSSEEFRPLADSLNRYFSCSPASVGWSLVRDCPYEFYWFDLTFAYSEPDDAIFYYDSARKEYYAVCLFEYDFLVNTSFMGAHKYETDPAKTGLVRTALQNAARIIANASEFSDEEKLTYYQNAIVSLVDYDFVAQARIPARGYGTDSNPWQLLWVFDDDPTTNVVCEGYAKAFKFLCDNTTFSHRNIQCHWVKGYFTGSSGKARHSWNIVHMSDGRNYLVDLTNCDAGGSHVNSAFFMASPARGSDTTGYYIVSQGAYFLYEYDTDTKGYYAPSTLILSGTPYDPAHSELKLLDTPRLKKASSASTGVFLTWDPVNGAEKYRVFRKTGNGSWQNVTVTSNTAYLDSSAVSGTTYIYTIRCQDITGTAYTSSYDPNGLSITYLAAPALTRIVGTNSGVSISWNASGNGVNYQVFRKVFGKPWQSLGTTTQTTFLDQTAISGTRYTYTVRCVNPSKTAYLSAYDPRGLTITYLAPPVLTGIKNTSSGITVSWRKPAGAVLFRVFRKVDDGPWVRLALTTSGNYTDKRVSSGKTYTYTVRCVTLTSQAYTSAYDTKGIAIRR